VRLREHRHLGELEAGKSLRRIELRLDPVALDPPLGTFGHFVFQETAQEARCRPALLVRALGELGPKATDRRQAQLAQHQRVAPGVPRWSVHAGIASACSLGSNAS